MSDNLELTKTLTIGKDFVTLVKQGLPNGIDVYEDIEDSGRLFFVHHSSGKVLFRMVIEVNCSQNVGIINNIDFIQ